MDSIFLALSSLLCYTILKEVIKMPENENKRRTRRSKEEINKEKIQKIEAKIESYKAKIREAEAELEELKNASNSIKMEAIRNKIDELGLPLDKVMEVISNMTNETEE